MQWRRIEREIRLLPQVLSCSVSDDEIVVLVAAAADPASVELAIAEVLGDTRTDIGIRVLGGTAPLIRAPAAVRAWRSPAILVGSVAATGILALSSLIGGLGTRDPGSSRPDPVIAGPHPTFPSRFPRPTAPEDEGIGDPPLVPALDVSGSGGANPTITSPPTAVPERPDPVLPDPRVPPVPPRAPTQPSPPTSTTCHQAEARGAPRDIKGQHRGTGPAPWSHSVLIDPHCSRGRPR